jgi:hypothetical protein
MWSTTESVIAHIERALASVDELKSKLPASVFKIEGMTGIKTRAFYNALCDVPEETNYFEIGAWGGSSTASALYGNTKITPYIVDNWSEFAGSYEVFHKNMSEHFDFSRVNLFQVDYKTMDLSTIPPIQIYLYDGPHERSDHVLAFLKYCRILAPISIVLVDDWNWECVQEGTREALAEIPFDVVYEKCIYTDYEKERATDYWNGIGIFVLRRQF